MTEPILVFVNQRAVRVPPASTAGQAVAACDPALGGLLAPGSGAPSAYLTDARGIRLDPSEPVYEGAILRVIVTARAMRGEADAQP